MKNKKVNAQLIFRYLFNSNMIMWSGWLIGILVVLNVLVKDDIQATSLIPLVQIFVQAPEMKKSTSTDDEPENGVGGNEKAVLIFIVSMLIQSGLYHLAPPLLKDDENN